MNDSEQLALDQIQRWRKEGRRRSDGPSFPLRHGGRVYQRTKTLFETIKAKGIGGIDNASSSGMCFYFGRLYLFFLVHAVKYL
jgi:hypothetical protein